MNVISIAEALVKIITKKQTRQELIKKLMWNKGGNGYGICAVAGMLAAAFDRPGPGKPDYISIVAINGDPKIYTLEELEKLARFSEEMTARYDKLFRWRRGANLILIGKEERIGQKGEYHWFRKQQSWTDGPMWSPSLDDALTVVGR
ncbi:MAG: hypothetical protein KGH93_01910 [Patescibacteria group bacterium]|nr:hypothetical protein [Patescibacteria group bacterium]MDE1945933.1 hypothetical protein [Patescibacteria group bacterium]